MMPAGWTAPCGRRRGSYRVVPGRDIAVLCGAVAPGDRLRPVRRAAAADIGATVTVRGYGAPRVHALQETTCAIQAVTDAGHLMLDCGLPPGTSGAPVTLAGSRDVVGVVSASSSNRTRVSRLGAQSLERLCTSSPQAKATP